MLLPFAKYAALGNSFVVLDRVFAGGRLRKFAGLARRICNPTEGIGADGFLIISGGKGRYRVDIYNADGSWAEKSGNGVRIAAMHMHNRGLVSGRQTSLETGSGPSTVTFHRGDDRRRLISATLGAPVFETSRVPVDVSEKYFINQRIKVGGRSYLASAVSIGNPHLVLFCDDFEFDWPAVGAELECHRLFPRRINVGFVVVRDKMAIEVRDWERGVGPTRSSGTGAAAAVGVNRLLDVHIARSKPQIECEPIFVALRSLPQGAPVTVWDVGLRDWPKAMMPSTALRANDGSQPKLYCQRTRLAKVG
jgi:diaminopimelate epimerase